eukprot:6248470-Amphidinium_carterae.1
MFTESVQLLADTTEQRATKGYWCDETSHFSGVTPKAAECAAAARHQACELTSARQVDTMIE